MAEAFLAIVYIAFGMVLNMGALYVFANILHGAYENDNE